MRSHAHTVKVRGLAGLHGGGKVAHGYSHGLHLAGRGFLPGGLAGAFSGIGLAVGVQDAVSLGV